MSKLQDFLDREQLMADRAALVDRQTEISNELARIDARLRNAYNVADVVNGVLITRDRTLVGLDSMNVSAIFEDRDPRFAYTYWSRQEPNRWFVRVGFALTGMVYDVLGQEPDQQWDQEQARNVAWNWLIYGRKNDVTPFVIEDGAS